jgi:hypothetical protein
MLMARTAPDLNVFHPAGSSPALTSVAQGASSDRAFHHPKSHLSAKVPLGRELVVRAAMPWRDPVGEVNRTFNELTRETSQTNRPHIGHHQHQKRSRKSNCFYKKSHPSRHAKQQNRTSQTPKRKTMDTFKIRVFQKHTLEQCNFLLMSINEIDTGLAMSNAVQIMRGIQNTLNAGANISKLLWGQKGKHAHARKRLRESIGISEDSPLREVSMRNHFEHIDERIDRWWSESVHRNHADGIIGPRACIAGLEPIDTFRWIDPTTKEVMFWGEAFNLQELASEANKILPKLRTEANKPHWGETF